MKAVDNWLVVRTKFNHELKAEKDLRAIGMEVYCPKQTEIKKWSDRNKKVITPLFKRLLFVKEIEGDKNQVFISKSVEGFLRVDKKNARVRDWELDKVRSYESGNHQLNKSPKPGDQIDVPMLNAQGYVLDSKDGFCKVELTKSNIKVSFKYAS
jgi:hypothetical protein